MTLEKKEENMKRKTEKTICRCMDNLGEKKGRQGEGKKEQARMIFFLFLEQKEAFIKRFSLSKNRGENIVSPS